MFVYNAEATLDRDTSDAIDLTQAMQNYRDVLKTAISVEISKNSGAALRGHEADSGSDSDPLEDEFTEKDKIKQVIGTKLAK